MTGAERIFDAITNLPDGYVDEAGVYRFVRRRRNLPAAWRRYAALAACLVLIAGGAFALSQVRMGDFGSSDGGGSGWSGGANGGGMGGVNTAPPPEGDEPSDAAPPTGPGAEGPPSGDSPEDGCDGGRPYWDSAAGAVPAPAIEAEGITTLREVTLDFDESGIVWVKDRYILTAGADGGEAVVRYDGPAKLRWSGDAAAAEDGGWRLTLEAGGREELVIRTDTAPADGVLALAEPEGAAVEETTVVVAGRQWMEEWGIAVTLGGAVIEP